MKLLKLQLENFRNYKTHTYEFPDERGFTVLVGENGKGKTNFLEAIYLLSLGRSFRTLHKEDLVKWDENYLRCTGEVETDGEITSLEVFYSCQPKQRNFKKNSVNKKNSEYIGNLLTVLFHPEDLNMLYMSPSFRRRYMDTLLSQTDRNYLYALSQFKKIFKQRNALLHAIRDFRFKKKDTTNLEADLDVWDSQILKCGSEIIQKRIELTSFLNKNLTPLYQSISSNEEDLSIEYLSKVKDKESYQEKLIQKREIDIITARSSVGPHLDDLKFCINGKEISSSASRGEFRTLLLAIKLAEIEFIREKTGKNPILLLDDVFSELDGKRQQQLLHAIKNCQTIITTTDTDSLGELAKESQSIRFVTI